MAHVGSEALRVGRKASMPRRAELPRARDHGDAAHFGREGSEQRLVFDTTPNRATLAAEGHVDLAFVQGMPACGHAGRPPRQMVKPTRPKRRRASSSTRRARSA